MKRFLSLLLSLFLLAAPVARADYEGEPQHSVNLSLACNPSTGYGWIASSSAEDVAVADDLDIATTEDDPWLVGSPAIHNFRITGVSAGEAYFTFSYERAWENAQPIYYFWLEVSVDEQLNVTVKPELVIPGSWDYDTDSEDVLNVTVSEPDEDGNQHFQLSAAADGYATLLLYNKEAGCAYEYQVNCSADGTAAIDSVSLRWEDEAAGVPFAPEFLFDTTDFEGNPVTEQILAGHSLTVLNFWEPWCGPCVGEMPDLQKISQEYASKGVQVIGVFATPDADEDVQAVLDDTGVTYPILRYTSEFDFLQTGYVPTTVLISGSGAIVADPFSGALGYDEWVKLIEGLL